MNILILADSFSKGGLETHINTYYEGIKKEKLFFGFSNYSDMGYLNNAKIYTGFCFSSSSTIEDFISDVNKLIEIIKENKIDVIHVHPFYCLFPAIFAANATNTKIVYTYHGKSSINFPSYSNDSILFDFAFEFIIGKIFCVSINGEKWFKTFKSGKEILFNNIINENKYTCHKVSFNKKWALVSRLDSDKKDEILLFFSWLKDLDIEKVDVYGDGNEKENLINFVKKNKLDKKIKFLGYSANIDESLNDYNGVIGLGRVALESLAMNYPTLIIGFGKIYGLIDTDFYNQIKYKNFVPTDFREMINSIDLNKQITDLNNKNLSKYQLRDIVIKDFGSYKINEYLEILKSIPRTSLTVIDKIFAELSKLENKKELFYSSKKVFDILNLYLSSNTNNPILKREITFFEKNNILENKIDINSNSIASHNSEIINIYNKIQTNYDDLYDKTNTINLNINEINKDIDIKENKIGTELQTLNKKGIEIENELEALKEEIKKTNSKMERQKNSYNKKLVEKDILIEENIKKIQILENVSFLTLVKRDFTKTIFRIKKLFKKKRS